VAKERDRGGRVNGLALAVGIHTHTHTHTTNSPNYFIYDFYIVNVPGHRLCGSSVRRRRRGGGVLLISVRAQTLWLICVLLISVRTLSWA
jgi:hypothetical protein